MSGKTPLVEPIAGYTVAVFRLVESGQPANCVMEEDLKLSKVGGAHITNAEALIMLLEDAVFQEEEKQNYDPTPWCHVCGAIEQKDCDCLPIAENN